jgi:hypothetical protein
MGAHPYNLRFKVENGVVSTIRLGEYSRFWWVPRGPGTRLSLALAVLERLADCGCLGTNATSGTPGVPNGLG